jgi:hypothetical protein
VTNQRFAENDQEGGQIRFSIFLGWIAANGPFLIS